MAVVDNQRVAKNTVILYIRTIFVMIISLYTSRIILKALGVGDFGIYQVVGGLVSIFSLISSSLSAAISRYITYEIGSGDHERLKAIFNTSVKIQYLLALIVLIVGEIISIWFIENEMKIPVDKISAARWVLQFSIITFCANIITVPYNACIIAHERMSAFAYLSILEVILKLIVAFMILSITSDRLIFYAGSVALISIVLRLIYYRYCKSKFVECREHGKFDISLFKEMLGFSGWNFLSGSPAILNTQGVTMLINVYFGLAFNTARGLASQVEAAVMQFVGNFTMAINPQITKSYASKQLDDMYILVCRGAKFSSFAMFIMMIPLILEIRPILSLWLGDYPSYTADFARLALIMGFLDCMGSSGYTACMATGKLKKYSLIIAPIGICEFIFSWIAFKCGAPAISTYLIYIVVKLITNIARMFLMKEMIGLSIMMYVKKVYIPVTYVLLLSFASSWLIYCNSKDTFWGISLTILLSVVLTFFFSYFVGMSNNEKHFIYNSIRAKLLKMNKQI